MPATPNQRIALAAGSCLVLGTVAGWALAQMGPRAAGPTVLAAGPSPVESPSAAPEQDHAQPGLAEFRPPRVEVQEQMVSPNSAALDGGGNVPRPEVAADLREELAAFLRSGRFDQLLVERGEDVTRFLVNNYLQANDPYHAMALLERFPREDADLYGSVAQALSAAGARDAAREMYLAAIERDPLDSNWIDAMREIDPAAALAAVDAQISSSEFVDDPLLAAQRASLLAAVGRGDEAKELLAKVLAKGAADEWTLDALLDVDPEWAERELRQRIDGENGTLYALRLAEHLVENERGEEGLALLEQVLARNPGQPEALESMLRLAPERALKALENGGLDRVDPWLLGEAGQQLAAAGRTSEAVDLWMRAAAADLSDEGAVNALLEHAPDRLWDHCREITADTRDDELLGDVGDLYWKQGRHSEAVQLWQRARSLDPGDGEWREKLRAASRGLDPL
jgi:tetratricopeptide (TPR) repeat protein